MNFEVTNTVREEWVYRAHPKDAQGQDSPNVTLIASVVSGDGSVVQDPAAPLDVVLRAGPTVDGITIFSVTAAGNVAPGVPVDIITMTQTAEPPPPPGPAASIGAELIGPRPQA